MKDRQTIVVDDERTFETGVHCRTWQDGIAQIERTSGWLLLYLDHDLGTNGDIMPLVDWLCENASTDPEFPDRFDVRVHSQNPVGARNVVRALARWGYRVHLSRLPNMVTQP